MSSNSASKSMRPPPELRTGYCGIDRVGRSCPGRPQEFDYATHSRRDSAANDMKAPGRKRSRGHPSPECGFAAPRQMLGTCVRRDPWPARCGWPRNGTVTKQPVAHILSVAIDRSGFAVDSRSGIGKGIVFPGHWTTRSCCLQFVTRVGARTCGCQARPDYRKPHWTPHTGVRRVGGRVQQAGSAFCSEP